MCMASPTPTDQELWEASARRGTRIIRASQTPRPCRPGRTWGRERGETIGGQRQRIAIAGSAKERDPDPGRSQAALDSEGSGHRKAANPDARQDGMPSLTAVHDCSNGRWVVWKKARALRSGATPNYGHRAACTRDCGNPRPADCRYRLIWTTNGAINSEQSDSFLTRWRVSQSCCTQSGPGRARHLDCREGLTDQLIEGRVMSVQTFRYRRVGRFGCVGWLREAVLAAAFPDVGIGHWGIPGIGCGADMASPGISAAVTSTAAHRGPGWSAGGFRSRSASDTSAVIGEASRRPCVFMPAASRAELAAGMDSTGTANIRGRVSMAAGVCHRTVMTAMLLLIISAP